MPNLIACVVMALCLLFNLVRWLMLPEDIRLAIDIFMLFVFVELFLTFCFLMNFDKAKKYISKYCRS